MIKKIVTYVGSNFLEAFITFLLIPIFTTKLSKEEYGTLVLYFIFSKFLFPIINLNLHSSASIEYFKREEGNFNNYLKTISIVPVFNLLAVTSIIYLLVVFDIMPFFNGNFVVFIPLFVWSQFLPNLYTSFCQAKNQSFRFGLIKNINALVNFLFTYILIEYTDFRVESQIIGSFVGNIILSIFLFFALFGKNFLQLSIKQSDIKFSLLFGMGVVFHSISGVIMSMADRFIIEDLKGLKEVGYYSVGYQITTVITIVATGISRSLVPTVYANLKENSDESKLKIVKYIYSIMIGLLCFCIIFYLFKDLIFTLLVDSKFNQAKDLILPLVFGLAFQGFYMFISSIFFYMKKNSLLSTLTIISAIINILLNYILIPKFGSLGAAYATVLTYFIFWVISWKLSNNIIKLPWFYFIKS